MPANKIRENIKILIEEKGNSLKPEDHWSCIAHLSAEDMLKSVDTEERRLKILNLSDTDQG